MNERRLNQDPERIRRRRVAAGLEAQALARLANISKGYLSSIEHGRANASPKVLGRIAAALDCTIADLMPQAHEEVKSA
ncbi:helix-turn-helix domain-containing protein [Nonomuraea sp. NPDC047897]|uniref:helix-turn-helix domain-containing protein n=1 Tax=Nonomuraea sp. NPDC047897 TaxID=3364346 RepID=UPI0037144D02